MKLESVLLTAVMDATGLGLVFFMLALIFGGTGHSFAMFIMLTAGFFSGRNAMHAYRAYKTEIGVENVHKE